MRPVKIRNLVLGEGKPKICVPVVARTETEVLQQTGPLSDAVWDLLEWRADWFEAIDEPGQIVRILRLLKNTAGERPVLFTVRTGPEGGENSPDAEAYIRWNRLALQAGADLIDVELTMGEKVLETLTGAAHAEGAYVIGSSHDFAQTPPAAELQRRLTRMREMGCDIAKIAVMPQNRADVLTLLQVTEQMSRELDCPVISMSMAKDGVISRLCGEVFGSCLTFGTVGKASAPGQIGTKDLALVLDIIHKSLNN